MGNNPQNTKIATAAFVLSIISLITTIGWNLYNINKDRTQLINKTEIVMCRAGQIFQQRIISNDLSKNSNLFEKIAADLQGLDLNGIDDDVLSYVTRLQFYFDRVKTTAQTDPALRNDAILDNESEQYNNLAKQFEELKNKLKNKYDLIINCQN